MNPTESIKNMENKLIKPKEDWLPLSLLFLLVMVFLHNGLFPLGGPQLLSSPYTDIRSYFYPILSFGFDVLSEGKIPLWNPYIYGGTPFIATLQAAIFYPLNCLYLILPISKAINWTIFLHLFLSGVFTYYLLKNYGRSRFGATVASIVYIFSAPHIMHIFAGHMVLLATIVWTPLMFLFLDRFIRGNGYKYGLFLSLTIALQLLAGYPQHLLYSLIALSLYLLFSLIWLYRKGVGWSKIRLKTLAFAAFIILALLLSAVQILPAAEMTKYSTRANLTYEWVSMFSFPPENLATFLIPDFFGDMLKVPYWGKNYLWEMTGYVGILPLILVFISIFCVRKRTVWFFGILAIASLILALGKYTPLLKLLYTYIPGFNLFRGNSKWIFLNAFSIAVISGFGADAVARGFKGLKNRRFTKGIIILALFIMAVLALMLITHDGLWFKQAAQRAIYSGDFYGDSKIFMQEGFETTAVACFRNCALKTAVLILLGTTALLLYAHKKMGRKVFIVSFFALIILDLFSFGMRYMVTFDSRELYWNRKVVNFLKQDKEPFRAIAPDRDVNSGMASKIETLSGYDAIMLKRYSEFINLSQGKPIDKPNLWVNIIKVNKLTNLLNAKYIVLPSGTKLNSPPFSLVFDNGQLSIYRDINALPRAFIVYNWKVMKSRDAIFKEVKSPEFSPAGCAIVEEEIGSEYFPVNKSANHSPVLKFVHYSPNKVTLEAQIDQPGLLILGDTYYPGWRAYIDDEETKIYRANYIMRAIALPKGKHLVEFHYKPFSFKMGSIVSLAAIVFVVGFLTWSRRKNKK